MPAGGVNAWSPQLPTQTARTRQCSGNGSRVETSSRGLEGARVYMFWMWAVTPCFMLSTPSSTVASRSVTRHPGPVPIRLPPTDMNDQAAPY